MPVKKYAATPTARMQTLYAAAQYKDLAVLDFSTGGHGVYNNGHLPWITPWSEKTNIFSTHITEVDISLGDTSRLSRAAEELKQLGYKNIYLMPSSLASVLGFDLSALAAEISDTLGINAFTVPSRLNDDFYAGVGAFTLALAKNYGSEQPVKKSGFNLLGGITGQDEQNHRYLRELISRRLKIKPNFDTMAAVGTSEWQSATAAEINVVTSKYALKTAEYYLKNFAVPYVYCRPLGLEGEEKLLALIAEKLGKKFKAESDFVYERAKLQIKNILVFNAPQIVCYGNTDTLASLKSFFDEAGYGAEYFCSHTGGDFPYADADEFIDGNKDKFVLASDRVCSFMPKSVVVENSGLDFGFVVPLPDANVGKEGAYRLMQTIAKKLM